MARNKNKCKSLLNYFNNYFKNKQLENEFFFQEKNLVLNRNQGVCNHFMRLINKTLIGLQNVRLVKRSWIAGLLGIGLGYCCSQFEDYYVQFKVSYKPEAKKVVIQHVLHNAEIKQKLRLALRENVFSNPDIQYNLHEVLVVKAIKPQQQDINQLAIKGICHALQSEASQKSLSSLAADQLTDQKETIADAALTFLGSPKMDSIIAKALSELMRSQMFFNLLSSQFIKIFNEQLIREQNKQSIYKVIRQKFILW